MAVQDVGTSPSGLPRDCPQCEYLTNASVQDVLLRSAYNSEGILTEEASLAVEWELAPDGSYTDFKLRRGVQFHEGWGELTAQDIAWTFNQVTADASVHATKAEVAAALKPGTQVEAIDDYTVRFTWQSFGIPTYPKTVTGYREGVGVFNKKAFEEKGADWMRNNVIGTGPFVLTEWTAGSRLSVEAVPEHWRKTPSIASATYIEVPEASSRRAMLESGQAQIAAIAINDWPALINEGPYEKASEGAINDLALIMGGNYWEKTHPLSGEPLQRNLEEYAQSRAWVGNPYEQGSEFNPNTPSMIRAWKVRQALSMSINREAINQALFKGLARPSYMGGVNDTDPIFQRVVEPIPYDVEGAKQLLQEAEAADDFDVMGSTIEVYAREASSLPDEVMRVVAAEWEASLGLDVKISNQPYASYRPNFINRTADALSTRTGGAFAPSTWQEEWYVSAIVSYKDGTAGGGFNSGMEIPKASETLLKKQSTASYEEAVAATEEYLRYMREEALWPGTVELIEAAVFDPNAICSWDLLPMASSSLAGARNLETVELCD